MSVLDENVQNGSIVDIVYLSKALGNLADSVGKLNIQYDIEKEYTRHELQQIRDNISIIDERLRILEGEIHSIWETIREL